MSSISLDNAWLLLIAVPLIVLIAVPFAIAIRKDNKNGHNITSCVLHVLLAVVIAFSAAGVTIETTLTETNVYVVADVSYSSNRNLGVIDEYIETLRDNLPNNSQMGVICFGKDYTINTKLGETFNTVKGSDVDDSQTDIVSALKYAGSIFKNDVIKRIVLITDSMQTGENGDDELKQTVDDLLASDIYVDAIYLDNNITEDVPEVQLTGVDCRQTAYKGRLSAATVTIQSTQSIYATVSLYRTDATLSQEPLESRKITLGAGMNEVNFTLDGDRESGVYGYEVRVDAEKDLNPYNNSCRFTQEVESEVKVLFITGIEEDGDAAKDMFAGMDVNLDVYYGKSVPYTVSEICEYDIIVLSNVDVETLNNYTMLIDSLDVAVSMLGKSLIAIGDLGLQNNTEDAALVKLAGMLPVNYGDATRDTKLFVILIDCSHSMFMLDRLTHAKKAAQALVGILDENDDLVVIKFYSENDIIYNGKVGDGKEACEKIENIGTLQGTMLNGALESIKNSYANANYSSKSVLLITDGLEGADDFNKSIECAKELHESGIGLSVIDVGVANDREATAIYMKPLAQYGGGKHYYYSYNENLGDEILPEISDDVSGAVVDNIRSIVNVSYKNYNDPVLDGLKDGGLIGTDKTSLEYVDGYILSSAKSGANTVLTTTYKKSSNQSISVPIYAYRGYGNGRAASFTSAISGDWISKWQSTKILGTLFSDMLTTNIPEERIDTPYSVTVNKAGDSYSVEIAPIEVRSGAKLSVTVTYPDGETVTGSYPAEDGNNLAVTFDSTVYTCSFATDITGIYQITVDYEYKDSVSNSYDYYADVSYLTEYDSFTLFEASLLYKVLGSTGTVSEDGNLSIVNDESRISKRMVSLTVPLLITAVVLFIVDIIIRKLKWNDIVSLFKKVNKGRKS